MVGNSFLLSESVHDLPASTQVLYLAMCMEAAGRRSFTFPEASMKKYGLAPMTAKRGIQALIDAGFISKTVSGKNTRTPNEYEFSFRWKGIV